MLPPHPAEARWWCPRGQRAEICVNMCDIFRFEVPIIPTKVSSSWPGRCLNNMASKASLAQTFKPEFASRAGHTQPRCPELHVLQGNISFVGLMVGLDDLRGVLQPVILQFYGSSEDTR